MPLQVRSIRTVSGRALDPRKIPDLALWLDASDSTTLFDATSGGSAVAADGSVARWEDKSGNARHFTQGTANNRPLRRLASLASRDGVEFDGSNDALSSSAFTHAAAFTLFVVHKFATTSQTAYGRVLERGANSGFAITVTGSPVKYTPQFVLDSQQADAITTSPSLLLFSCNGSSTKTMSLSVNNGSATTFTSTSSPTSSQAMHLAQYGTGGYHTSQTMYELVYFARLLGSAELDVVREHLRAKWSVY